MIDESDGLIRTFDALLMIARAESGQARDNMIEFEPSEILRGVGELYEPLAEEKGLAVTVDASEGTRIKGNRELLSQALANLVDNAIKYARPATPQDAANVPADIVLSTRTDGDRVLLSVADHGPGIPAADRARVVERFVRLADAAGEPGSGLGLSLAAAVARLHGGELILEDNAPGLRVLISLPRH
jgi:signal transduction histidine kinase